MPGWGIHQDLFIAAAAGEPFDVMQRKKRPILAAGCVVSIALFGLLLLQCAGIGPRLCTSWGDGIRARGYLVWLDGSLMLQTATSLKTAPPDLIYGPRWLGRGLDVVGFHYHRWNDVTETLNGERLPDVYGTYSEFWVAPGWIMLLTLVMPSMWLRHYFREHELVRNQELCRNCGYDLRATPGRCPGAGEMWRKRLPYSQSNAAPSPTWGLCAILPSANLLRRFLL